MKNHNELLLWIEKWFYKYCDGDWEHNQVVSIYTIDNPGWAVTIDLEGTFCENKELKGINMEISTLNWYHCFLRDNKFEGAGVPAT